MLGIVLRHVTFGTSVADFWGDENRNFIIYGNKMNVSYQTDKMASFLPPFVVC